MSEKLPRVSAQKVIRVLLKLGFILVRQSGCHKVFKNAEGVMTVVSYHAGKVLGPKLPKSIIRDMGLTVTEFRKLLK